MKIDMPLVRIEIYLRETAASIVFVRKTEKPRRTLSAWYHLKLSKFPAQFSRLMYHYGKHKFNALPTGTWVYYWEVNNDQNTD